MNMDKIKNLALLILVLLLTGMTIRTCRLQKKQNTLQEELNLSKESLTFLMDHPVTKTDTVYFEDIQPHQGFKDEVKPSKVIYPKKSQSLGGQNPGQGISEENLANTRMPAISPRDSLLGFNLNKNRFTLTFQNPSFGNHQSEYQIRPNEYQYTWADGKLTAKRLSIWKRLEVKPYSSLSYRPIHNLWDLEVGISFKTKSLNYNLGLNGFYYPQWQKHPGLDAQIRITYNF